jgi:hypothetical protein
MFGGAGTHEGLAALLVAAQGRIDHALRRIGRSRRDDGAVGLGELPGHHRLAEEACGRLGLGGEDHAGGVAVEPVDQPRARLARLGEGPQQFVQRIGLAAPTLAGETRGLVQGQDVGVLVDHQSPDQGDLFWVQLDRRLDLVARAQGRRSLRSAAQRSSRSLIRASEPSPFGS